MGKSASKGNKSQIPEIAYLMTTASSQLRDDKWVSVCMPTAV